MIMSSFPRIRLMTLGAALVAAFTVATVATADEAQQAVPQADGDNPYKLSVSNAKAKAGEEAKILITIEAAAGYKCNESYPHKARKLEADAGAELPNKTVKGKVEDKKVVIAVPVKAAKAGTYKVRGQVKFSVCNDSQCVIKKAPLDATFTASE